MVDNRMSTDVSIALNDKPRPEDVEFLFHQLYRFNEAMVGTSGFRPLVLELRNSSGELVGGVHAAILWNWLHVEVLWVAQSLHKQGWGDRLLAAVEAEARSHGATHSYLDTFSFQALGFYVRRGYRVFGELQEFPPGHKRCWLVKSLDS